MFKFYQKSHCWQQAVLSLCAPWALICFSCLGSPKGRAPGAELCPGSHTPLSLFPQMFPLPVANGKGRPTSLAGAQFGGSGRIPWLGAAGGLGNTGWAAAPEPLGEDTRGGHVWGRHPAQVGQGVRGLGPGGSVLLIMGHM